MTLIRNFFVDTTKGLDVLKIIHEVRRVVKEANTQNGTVTVVVTNPGAGLAILDPSEKVEEVKKGLEPQVASGLVRSLLPKSLVMPFEKGRMLMEPWQEIFLIDYDTSARRREFKVHVSPEAAPAAPCKCKKGAGHSHP